MAPEPYLKDADVTLYHGDCLEVLRTFPDRSVHMCATSPPFYGLRDYGTGTWEGGDEGCDHIRSVGPSLKSTLEITGHGNSPEASERRREGRKVAYGVTCGKCGAVRTDRQIGLEESPDEWVARLVEVFREVRRVLRDDGTLWVEIGDSYCNLNHAPGSKPKLNQRDGWGDIKLNSGTLPSGTKAKDILGQPWLLAFALRADGWYLRSEIIWARPNPMPESVTDRPTKAHSTVFLLSKSPRYFYDQEAIRETVTSEASITYSPETENGANARSVWTIPTEPTPFAHFATWPQKLCQRMILAGTSERGVCPECGAPWVREVERPKPPYEDTRAHGRHVGTSETKIRGGKLQKWLDENPAVTTGWQPSCSCDTANGNEDVLRAVKFTPEAATILDPFGGSGTTALVARKLGRKAILIELNEEYCVLASQRLAQQSLFAVADD